MSYKQAINQFLTFVEGEKTVKYDEISFQHWSASIISEYLVYLEHERKVSASTRNQRLFAIRSFLKYARISNPELTILTLDACGIATAKESKEPVTFLSENAMKVLLSRPDDSTRIGLRDMCFMVAMYDTAARDCEMLRMRLNSLDLNDTCPKVRLEGKGNKVRQVPLMKKTADHLYFIQWIPMEMIGFFIQFHTGKGIKCQTIMFRGFFGSILQWLRQRVLRFPTG